MISSNDFRPGVTIEFKGGVWQIIEAMHVKPGKGSAFVKTKLKNVETSESLQVTFRAGERVQRANIEKIELIYLYRKDEHCVLLNADDNDSIDLEAKLFGQNIDLLKEGQEGITALRHRERYLQIVMPNTVDLGVSETSSSERGDTVSGGSKFAVLETGAKVTVPFHVKVNDVLRVDTRTREYRQTTFKSH